jgi:hypothetical protein
MKTKVVLAVVLFGLVAGGIWLWGDGQDGCACRAASSAY